MGKNEKNIYKNKNKETLTNRCDGPFAYNIPNSI
jgi:hypothetical protein